MGVGAEVVDERPVIEADYTKMGDVWVLAFYCVLRHVGAATVVAAKGTIGLRGELNWFIEKLHVLNFRDIRLCVGGEPAMGALARNIAERH